MPNIPTPAVPRLSEERRAEIRARLAASTGDRWAAQEPDPAEDNGVAIIAERADVPTGDTPTNGMVAWLHGERFGAGNAVANADLIANAPTDLAELLAELDRRDALLQAPEVRDALRGLAARWRNLASLNHYDYRSAMLRCSDDLLAILDALASDQRKEPQS